MILDWVAPAAGAVLLGLLAYDVFRTAFHAEGRGGPINRAQNRALWRLVRWLGTRGGRPRGSVLSLAGPLMAVTTIAVWSALLLLGFALVYLPWVPGFHVSPGQPGPQLLEAFYYSGIIAATLGQGDVVAAGTAMRIITILQALAGFAGVTVAVSYVLAIYRELTRSRALAAAIAARLDAVLPGAGGAAGDAADWDRTTAEGLAHALEAHFNYPILHYFRASEERRSLPYQATRLHRSLGPGDGSLSRGALRSMISRYGEEVHALFVRPDAPRGAGPAETGARLAGILEMLALEPPAGDGDGG